MGFNLKAGGLKVETSIYFVYLTEERKSQKHGNKIFINIMFIDPYYDKIQISLFKSSSYFPKGKESKLNDEILKCIVYNTGQDIKVI